jgi:hypothetical protein
MDNYVALRLLQRIAGGLVYTASSSDLICEAERVLAQLGFECPNCDHGRILGVKWEQKLDSSEPVPIESEEPCETCGGSGFAVRDIEQER